MNPNKQMKIALMLCLIAGSAAYAVNAYAKTRRQMVKQSVDPDVAMRKWMLEISRQMGVTCTYCHNTKNFKDNSMDTFKVAMNHIEVVEWLNREGFYKDRRGTQATCFMCHRGKAKPDYEEKVGVGN